MEVYDPTENFLIYSENKQNYFSLSVIDAKLVFTGDPFNDYNGVFIQDKSDPYDLMPIVQHFTGTSFNIEWRNLFEKSFLKTLSKIGKVESGSSCLRVHNTASLRDYDEVASDSIKKMYHENSSKLIFNRIFPNESEFDLLLERILNVRQDKLQKYKMDQYNPSFDNEFKEFIANLTNFKTLQDHMFIDYCVSNEEGKLLAANLNFIKNDKTLCYLRSHTQSGNKVSYGLILDYWSNKKSINEGVDLIDYTRGDESYKFRLGAEEDQLKNFKTDQIVQ